ncbi:D-glucuronyl C5-epimerase family protein [Herbaspirillum sp. WKF16]|uniref:D-glucuronyl C5-epimerase family protein n=1 Tax=Herbaspirillum sp. WKF16 TaxID=3028312 RepID=UPI0023A9BC1E|nr:D-glucuronyl C5-epimerase family protein [Herbaspirillum sp. WKF16]WDZ98002.1 D-glucuronyl C5-epimerase family protein [Herbaspirillum sp. WKF16]
MKKIILVTLLLSIGLVAGCQEPSTQLSVPASTLKEIAKVTNTTSWWGGRSKSEAFIVRAGGDRWFKNYRKQFAHPGEDKGYIAETVDVTGPKLGNYYVRGSGQREKSDHMIPPQCAELSTMAPTTQIYCGLSAWNAYLVTSDPGHKATLLAIADHVLKEQKDGKFEWTKEIPSRDLKAPWISALTQSVATSLFLRVYQETRDQRYMDAATSAYRWLTVPLEEGGVLSIDHGNLWLEEYPNIRTPSHVLNGHMLSLFGAWDYYRVTGDQQAKSIVERGLASVPPSINKYDTGYWLTYDQVNQGDFINGDYLACIIAMFDAAAAISKNPFFSDTATRWKDYQTNDRLFVHLAAEAYKNSLKK